MQRHQAEVRAAAAAAAKSASKPSKPRKRKRRPSKAKSSKSAAAAVVAPGVAASGTPAAASTAAVVEIEHPQSGVNSQQSPVVEVVLSPVSLTKSSQNEDNVSAAIRSAFSTASGTEMKVDAMPPPLVCSSSSRSPSPMGQQGNNYRLSMPVYVVVTMYLLCDA